VFFKNLSLFGEPVGCQVGGKSAVGGFKLDQLGESGWREEELENAANKIDARTPVDLFIKPSGYYYRINCTPFPIGR
jgi:hypothetical protein